MARPRTPYAAALDDAPEPVAPAAESTTYPVVYYNPRIIDEQFYVIGSPYRQRFVKGRFLARNAEEEASVRACLSAHGRGKADRWRGDDRNKEWVDRRTGFRTANDAAKDDFEHYHEN